MNKPKILIPEEEIRKRVLELGQTISKDYAGKPIVCVGVLKGSVIFFSDLIRHIDLPLTIDFLGASSYGKGTVSSGVVKFTLDLSLSIEGKHVLVIEDIVDTGLTIDYLMENLKLRNPASLKLCALLLKPARLKNQVHIDYLGFTIEDKFVVGYGLDAGEKFRNLPYLAAIEDYSEK